MNILSLIYRMYTLTHQKQVSGRHKAFVFLKPIVPIILLSLRVFPTGVVYSNSLDTFEMVYGLPSVESCRHLQFKLQNIHNLCP